MEMFTASLSEETSVRLLSFVGVLAILITLEALFPRRKPEAGRLKRWPHNIGISVVSQLVVRLTLPLTAVALATTATANQWGVLNHVALPASIEFVVAVLILDLVIYWQHRLYHYFHPLWRLHRMHHADVFFDATTGIRFHPLSILLSVIIKLATVLAIGPSALAVLVFEVLLNATSLFNHSNVYISPAVDRYLRLMVVTPDMHRVHHSSDGTEMNCNFGFNFPWWDRIFETYLAQPRAGHEKMEIGLKEFRDARERDILHLLSQPFRSG